VDRLVGLLRDNGLKAEVFTDLAVVTESALREHRAGRLRALVGVGGDGTAAELVNRTPPELPIALLPAGNENLLARYVGLNGAPEALCRTIVKGSITRLDAGIADGRVFLLMASCGFDAEVVRRVHSRRRGHVRWHSYVKPILEVMRSYQYPKVRVCWEQADVRHDVPTPEKEGVWSECSAEVRWLFVFNLPCYGARLRLAPQAVGTDALLDLCGFTGGSLWDGLRYVTAALRGRHRTLPDCLVRRVRRLRIASQTEVPYQLDGDPGGVLPVEIEVLPGRLTLIVPRETEKG